MIAAAPAMRERLRVEHGLQERLARPSVQNRDALGGEAAMRASCSRLEAVIDPPMAGRPGSTPAAQKEVIPFQHRQQH